MMLFDLAVVVVLFAALILLFVRTADASRQDAELRREEQRWVDDRAFPRSVRRRYAGRRQELLDRPRMRMLGYTETERRRLPSRSLAAQPVDVIWSAERPPAAPTATAQPMTISEPDEASGGGLGDRSV